MKKPVETPALAAILSYMKKIGSSNRSLEGFRAFPYVAWGLIILFAFFVYKITLELQAVTNDLSIQNQQVQFQIDTLENRLEKVEDSSRN